jgi:hypothetical protein
LRSLTADLQFIQLQRLVDGASGLTTSAASRTRKRPRDYPAADERDELAPPQVEHATFLPEGDNSFRVRVCGTLSLP